MYWCTIKKETIENLKNIDKRIPNIEYGEKGFKPFFAPLFKNGNFIYVTQVTSPKERHKKIKNTLDFIKLYDENNAFIGAVNLNYMFPVLSSDIIKVEYNNIDKFRKFEDLKAKGDYISLLKREMHLIRVNDIQKKAVNLYNLKNEKPGHVVSKRCLDFKALEKYFCYEMEEELEL